MATYYVGPSSAGAGDGSSWENRFGSLNDAEDLPLFPGDTVIVGPGVYRESLGLDNSGSAGAPITYVGDITGCYTDGIGGIVRITGSNDDESGARSRAVFGNGIKHRVFKNLVIDGAFNYAFTIESGACAITFENIHAINGVHFKGSQENIVIRQSTFIAGSPSNLEMSHSSAVDDSGNIIENCIFMGGASRGVYIERVGGILVRNCLFNSLQAGVRIGAALSASQYAYVYNNLFFYSDNGVWATAASEMIEDYNGYWRNTANRNTVSTGSNSKSVVPVIQPPFSVDGIRLPIVDFHAPTSSALYFNTESACPPEKDFWGIERPTTPTKICWGPFQPPWMEQSSEVTYSGSGKSIKLMDAGTFQMLVPVSPSATTFTVQCYMDTGYTGSYPLMRIRQEGREVVEAVMTGSAGEWNKIETVFTPSERPPYLAVEFVSRNTAASGEQWVYFDDFTVT